MYLYVTVGMYLSFVRFNDIHQSKQHLHLSDVIIRELLFTYFLLITMIAMFLTETFLRHKLFEKKEEEH